MANKTSFLFTSLLAMIMILLVGCGNTAVSRRNFTPPLGINPLNYGLRTISLLIPRILNA